LIGILAGRGKARGFVLGSTNALLVIALASIVTGVVAMTSGQPYAVYYPLLLIGVIIGIVIGFLRGRVSNRYEQLELKRMQSMDA
jgi:H+/Cl- antiporter ClcA